MVLLIWKLPHDCNQINKGGERLLKDSANAGITLAVQGRVGGKYISDLRFVSYTIYSTPYTMKNLTP